MEDLQETGLDDSTSLFMIELHSALICLCVFSPDAKYYAKNSFAPLNLYNLFTKPSVPNGPQGGP